MIMKDCKMKDNLNFKIFKEDNNLKKNTLKINNEFNIEIFFILFK
jgi:hypothetical protein